eukprot:5501430-Lingulodinium_polyedra.AAC.1
MCHVLDVLACRSSGPAADGEKVCAGLPHVQGSPVLDSPHGNALTHSTPSGCRDHLVQRSRAVG